MKIRYLLGLLFCLNVHWLCAQFTFHQDIFYGGVTMGGFSTDHQSYASTGVNPLELYIEPGSTIRNAYLFHYQVGPSITSTVTLNGTEFVFTSEDEILNVGHANPIATPVRYLYKDITSYLNSNLTSTFNIEVECEANTNYGGFSAFLYIEYENPQLEKVSSNFIINNHFIAYEINMIINLSEMDTSETVGLALFFDNLGCQVSDTEDIILNNEYLGTLECTDSINFNVPGGGVKGHFYYQNNQLIGLDDDIANTLVDGTDAICDISSYMSNNNQFSLDVYDNSFNGLYVTNYPLFFVNAYSTPCDTFSTGISQSQTICQGDSVLLTATGGIESYQWFNNATLSDSLNASVYAYPDSTTTYVVQIENSPGCYRTEKVTVDVNEVPVISGVEIFPPACGEPDDGMIQINTTGSDNLEYSINDEIINGNTFENLSEGTYSIAVSNEFNCTADSIVYLLNEIGVTSHFEATPLVGDEPLLISTENNSTFANNYQWLLDDVVFSSEENPSFILDTNGVYHLSLIAYNNVIECADTFNLSITVHNALLVQIPNIFTPNNDGLNDEFKIKTDDVVKIKTQIYNRWGNQVYTNEQAISPILTISTCWDGKNDSKEALAHGTYYYIITVIRPNGEAMQYQGNVMMVE